MKAKIRLMTSYKMTAAGYPVVVELTHLKLRKRRTIAHAFIDHWNTETNLPTKQHPDYNVMMPEVLEVKSKVATINLRNMKVTEAIDLLFMEHESYTALRFYDAGLAVCDGPRDGLVYKSVLNSFNGVYPGVFCDAITPTMVTNYMKLLLLTNKPNGVHMYLRTLDAIFKRITDIPSPFKGIRPRRQKTPHKGLKDDDLLKLKYTRVYVKHGDTRNTFETINYDRDYWFLMFYLGGIDMVDLASLRYDTHVINGRIEFYRNKGGTNAFISNLIMPEAYEILEKFDCKPYLVPVHKYTNYNSFMSNLNIRFCENTADLQLTRRPLTKSARHTFINRARDLFIDSRITMEIVGHEQPTIHSVYTDKFTDAVRDEAHKRIIDLAK